MNLLFGNRYFKMKIDQDVMKDAVEIWGKDAQLFMVIEEVAELIQALSKWRRHNGDNNRRWVIEELADVLIMLNQLIVMFDISETEINDVLEHKTKRLQQRLKNHGL